MIKEDILKLIEAQDVEASIFVKSLRGRQWDFKYQEEMILPSASTIKNLIMVEAFRQIEEGKFGLEEKVTVTADNRVDFSIISELDYEEYSLLDLIIWMIIISDNTATNVLIDLLGYERINEMAEILGCKNTLLQRKMMDFQAAQAGRENLTTVADMAKIMEEIYRQSILQKESCQLMMDILKRQRYKDRLLRYIVNDESLASKTGELDGISHDIGIFFLDKVDYLIGVFVKHDGEENKGKKVIGRISQLVYNHYRGDIFE